MPTLDAARALQSSERIWEQEIVPALHEYIRIPNKSPAYEPKWEANMDRAVALIEGWCRKQPVAGLKLEVVRLPNRTPVILMEIPGEGEDTVLLYGHLDKQPEMTGWREGLSPWTPVREGNKLYGRGGADDGYSSFASLTALRLLQEQGISHARCVVLIEAGEESGSPDLPAYIEHLAARIGTPSLVVCLDSGCGNYDQLWLTTSLRGVVVGTLEVSLLAEGVHSGDASGVVASSFRVLRSLLDRLEDPSTGDIIPADLAVAIPPQRVQQAGRVAETLGDEVWSKLPLPPAAQPLTTDRRELILNRTWRPALAITGAEGLPAIAD